MIRPQLCAGDFFWLSTFFEDRLLLQNIFAFLVNPEFPSDRVL